MILKHSSVSPTALRWLWISLDRYNMDFIICLQSAAQSSHCLTDVPTWKNWIFLLSLTSCHRNLYNSCSKKKSVYFYTGDLGSVRILEKHLALLMKNLCLKYNGMHTLWNCARIWRKIKVEQLISYMSVFSKKIWNQAVKTRNLAMPSSAKICAHSSISTVQRDRDPFNIWLLPAIILLCPYWAQK